MAFNTALFQKIHEVISPAPGTIAWDKFDMSSWEDVAECGTTRCVAGWAIYLATGQPVYADGLAAHSEAVGELARRLGARMYNNRDVDLEDLGAKLLGLETSRDRSLFYADGLTAAEFVRLAAKGEDDRAREVLDR